METEKKYIQNYLAGDASAFYKIYSRYERPLFFYIRSMMRPKEEAKDVFQDVWIQALNKLSTFSCNNSFRNWLYAIARNKIIDRARKSNRVNVISLDDESYSEGEQTLHDFLADPAPDIVQQLTIKEVRETMYEMVELLPETHREVFLLRCDAEMKFREIAEMLGVSINIVLGRMHSAVKQIRKELQTKFEL